jgi:hypothetical protein
MSLTKCFLELQKFSGGTKILYPIIKVFGPDLPNASLLKFLRTFCGKKIFTKIIYYCLNLDFICFKNKISDISDS